MYRTVAKAGYFEHVAERSKFLAYIERVSSREEAEMFFARVRSGHRDARHNVPAYSLFAGAGAEPTVWASDDGEPQGTAGQPILRVLTGAGITNAAIVVTRYFGGVLLGTGGLVRAYTEAAKGALAASGAVDVVSVTGMVYKLSYPDFERLRPLASEDPVSGGFSIGRTEYSDTVKATIAVTNGREEETAKLLTNLSGGRAEHLGDENTEIEVPVSL
jgi:uncharacterized YigZ family protein